MCAPFYLLSFVHAPFVLLLSEPLTTPAAFVSAVAAPRRGDLAGVLSALGGQEASWDAMFQVDSAKLKAAGVNTKERRWVRGSCVRQTE